MKAKTTLYQEIYDYLKDQINTGKLKSGDRVPSEAELAVQFAVSRITSKRALELLAEENILFRIPGKGTFVGPMPEKSSYGLLRQKTIGIILSDFSSTYGANLLKSMILSCGVNGYLPSIVCTEGNQELEDISIQRLHDNGVSGLIVIPVHGENYSHTMLKLVVDGFPLVTIDRLLHGIPAPYVGSDNISAVRNTIHFLAGHGHRRIGIISPVAHRTSSIQDRISGFEAGMNELKLPWYPDQVLTDLVSMIPGNFSSEKEDFDDKKIQDYVTNNPDMTALISVEYGIAIKTCKIARKLGRRVPEDLTIISFDGPDGNEQLTGIGQLLQQESKIGEYAVDLVDQLIRGEKTTKKIFLDVELRPAPDCTGFLHKQYLSVHKRIKS